MAEIVSDPLMNSAEVLRTVPLGGPGASHDVLRSVGAELFGVTRLPNIIGLDSKFDWANAVSSLLECKYL
jgi:hypothetical protein